MDYVSQSGKISFYEMVPMVELQAFVRQALTYVLNIATSHYERLIPLRYYTHEIVFGTELGLQAFYLRRKSATYAEAFYSFKRSRVGRDGTLKTLSKVDIFISLFFETILPFLQIKVEEFLEKRAATEAATGRKTKATKWLLRVFKLVSRVTKALLFAYSFRYLISADFSFYKPYYQWFGFLIRRMNNFEQRKELEKPLLLRLLSQYNVFLLFLFKTYCEWYFGARMQQIQARETAQRLNGSNNSLVKPPVADQKNRYGRMVSPMTCALCQAKPMVHPCVLETSGFAFCYPCASAYIQEHGSCPLTRVPSTTTQLRKIFIQ